MFITDTQWGNALTVIGEDYVAPRWNPDPTLPKQSEFW